MFENCDFTPIPVIATFSDKGKMQPLYAKINGVSLTVTSCYLMKQDCAFITFACNVENDGYEKPVIISYSIREHCWVLN